MREKLQCRSAKGLVKVLGRVKPKRQLKIKNLEAETAAIQRNTIQKIL